MRSPLVAGSWLELDEVDSTQNVAAEHLTRGSGVGVVFAHEQLSGRGRFGRKWLSRRGDSLTASLIFHDYADHPLPHLIGMSVAVAAAGALYSQLRWPNDLIIAGRKVAGILTELLPRPDGRRVPVVGLGVNLNQQTFPPELAEIATSLSVAHGGRYEADAVLRLILSRLEELPEPKSWLDLAPIWGVFDKTPGKPYKLSDGATAVAVGLGSEGQLLCSVDGESRTVLAAEALFGGA
jgi:BirA family biotin operon repressor/biotin-[acetyl-CoA-carboxylase] ligase